jgi:hypothetical protein
VRRAAKVLKKKDPEQLFPALCQQVLRCAREYPQRKKNSHAKRKTDQLHNSAVRNHLEIPDLNKLQSSCAKL